LRCAAIGLKAASSRACNGKYYHELPFVPHGDWEHYLRTSRRNLYNPNTSLTFGVAADDGSREVASWGVIEELKDILGPRGDFLASILRFNAFMDQNGDAANKLFHSMTIKELEKRVDAGELPDGCATLLLMKMVNMIIAPIQDPNFGDPFVCATSMWAGLSAMRRWRMYVKGHPRLTLTANFISLEMYNTTEIIVHGATNHYLSVKRHASKDAPAVTAVPPPAEYERGAVPRPRSTDSNVRARFELAPRFDPRDRANRARAPTRRAPTRRSR
jgi:hypothetical protein